MFLAVCTALTLNLVAFADGKTSVDGRAGVSLEYIIDDWIGSLYQGDASVSHIVGLCDPDNVSKGNIGHLVSFEKNGTPSGYIVLSREEVGDPIVEFALDGESIYDVLEDRVAEKNKASAVSGRAAAGSIEASPFTIATKDILYTNFINYSMAIKRDEQVILLDQFDKVREFKGDLPSNNGSTYASIYDGYVPLPSESTSYTSGTINGATSNVGLKMEDLASCTNEGNCAPTAATNVINLYAKYNLNGNGRALSILLANNNTKFTYDRIATLMDYVPGKGGTPAQVLTGMREYCSERGRSYSDDEYSYNYWSDFTRDVKKNVPIYLATYADDGGHSQVVVGYREYSNGKKYLMSYTGWTTNATYIKFKASCFTGFYGWAIYIS